MERTNARANATRWASPRERDDARRKGKAPSPTVSSAASTRLSMRVGGRPIPNAGAPGHRRDPPSGLHPEN